MTVPPVIEGDKPATKDKANDGADLNASTSTVSAEVKEEVNVGESGDGFAAETETNNPPSLVDGNPDSDSGGGVGGGSGSGGGNGDGGGDSNDGVDGVADADDKHDVMNPRRNSLMPDDLIGFDGFDDDMDDEDGNAPLTDIFETEPVETMPPPTTVSSSTNSEAMGMTSAGMTSTDPAMLLPLGSTSSNSNNNLSDNFGNVGSFGMLGSQSGAIGKGLGQGNSNSTPTWHNDTADAVHREEMIGKIQELLLIRKKGKPDEKWLGKLSLKARKLEDFLYRGATSLEEYKNKKTLKKRLTSVAKSITDQHGRQGKDAIRNRSADPSNARRGPSSSSVASPSFDVMRQGVDAGVSSTMPTMTSLHREQSETAVQGRVPSMPQPLARGQSDSFLPHNNNIMNQLQPNAFRGQIPNLTGNNNNNNNNTNPSAQSNNLPSAPNAPNAWPIVGGGGGGNGNGNGGMGNNNNGFTGQSATMGGNNSNNNNNNGVIPFSQAFISNFSPQMAANLGNLQQQQQQPQRTQPQSQQQGNMGAQLNNGMQQGRQQQQQRQQQQHPPNQLLAQFNGGNLPGNMNPNQMLAMLNAGGGGMAMMNQFQQQQQQMNMNFLQQQQQQKLGMNLNMFQQQPQQQQQNPALFQQQLQLQQQQQQTQQQQQQQFPPNAMMFNMGNSMQNNNNNNNNNNGGF